MTDISFIKSLRFIQQFQLFLAHPTPPWKRLVNCLASRHTLNLKSFINHCMYNNLLQIDHSFLQGWNPPFFEGPPLPLSGYPLFLKQI